MKLRSAFLYIELKRGTRTVGLGGLFCQVFLFVEHILFVQWIYSGEYNDYFCFEIRDNAKQNF